MTRDAAIQIQKLALEPVRSLTQIVAVEAKQYPEYQTIKRGTGLCIGQIQMDIPEVINKLYPELDDLK